MFDGMDGIRSPGCGAEKEPADVGEESMQARDK